MFKAEWLRWLPAAHSDQYGTALESQSARTMFVRSGDVLEAAGWQPKCLRRPRRHRFRYQWRQLSLDCPLPPEGRYAHRARGLVSKTRLDLVGAGAFQSPRFLGIQPGIPAGGLNRLCRLSLAQPEKSEPTQGSAGRAHGRGHGSAKEGPGDRSSPGQWKVSLCEVRGIRQTDQATAQSRRRSGVALVRSLGALRLPVVLSLLPRDLLGPSGPRTARCARPARSRPSR